MFIICLLFADMRTAADRTQFDSHQYDAKPDELYVTCLLIVIFYSFCNVLDNLHMLSICFVLLFLFVLSWLYLVLT